MISQDIEDIRIALGLVKWRAYAEDEIRFFSYRQLEDAWVRACHERLRLGVWAGPLAMNAQNLLVLQRIITLARADQAIKASMWRFMNESL